MELKGRRYCDYEHDMATEIPQWMQNEAVNKLDELLNLTRTK